MKSSRLWPVVLDEGSMRIVLCFVAAAALLSGCYLTHEPERSSGRAAPDSPAPLVLHPQMARGSGHACVLLDDGSVHCWGSNTFGQLGAATPDASAWFDGNAVERPVHVEGLPPIARISASSAQSCALDVDGRVHCWGLNEQGQLGVGLDGAPDDCLSFLRGGPATPIYDCARRPIEVPGIDRAIHLSAGDAGRRRPQHARAGP